MRLPQIKNPKTIESLLWCLLDMSGELADLMYEKPKAIVDVSTAWKAHPDTNPV